MVESALKDIAPVGIEIAVSDDTDARPVTVCRHSSRVQSPEGATDREESSGALESTWPTDFFGRKLALRCGATEAFYARRTIWQPWVLLCGGLALTFAGVGHQISRALRACAIERAVTTRLAAIQPLIGLMRGIGQAHGDKSPAQVALNWLLLKGAVPIPGAKNGKQARDNAGALGWRLTEAETAALDEASGKL